MSILKKGDLITIDRSYFINPTYDLRNYNIDVIKEKELIAMIISNRCGINDILCIDEEDTYHIKNNAVYKALFQGKIITVMEKHVNRKIN